MSHRNKLTLVKQVEDALTDKLAIGQNKYLDKRSGRSGGRIYSWNTYRAYLRHGCYFVKWCKARYRVKTLDDCRKYASEWIRERTDQGLSAYTIKLEVSALAKIYSCSPGELQITSPNRSRSAIVRSRGEAIRDRHFSEARNAEFVEFCRCTGLRRSEIACLRYSPDMLSKIDQTWYLTVSAGTKGGKVRRVPIIGSPEAVERVLRRLRVDKQINTPIWSKVPNGADIHSYRADYATALYQLRARPLEVCKAEPFYNKQHINGKGKPKGGFDKNSVYWCRGDQKGRWLDKKAMLEVSQALGHDRISVVGEHYIR